MGKKVYFSTKGARNFILIILLTNDYHMGIFSENYHDCLNDVKAATALQPSYLKAIIRGENESHLKI